MGAQAQAPAGKGAQAPNMNNQWGGNQNYYGGFQGAGNVYDQSSAGLGGAMNAAFQGLNYQPNYNPGGGSSSAWGGGFGGAGTAGNAMNAYNPATINGGSYGSGTLANTDFSQYMNPYTENVIDQNMADMNRARQMEQMQTGAKATNAGAFGGDRHGLMEAENNRNFYDQAGAMSGQLRNQGFQNAQQAAQFDIGNQNQASQFNIGQDMQSQLANQQAQWQKASALNDNEALNAQLANQAGIARGNNATSRWNNSMNADLQAAQHRLNSASQLANFSNLGFGMGNTMNNQMYGQGQNQQAMYQALIDSAKGQWGGYQGAPGQAMDWRNAAAGVNGGTSSSSTPGLMDWAGTALGAYGGYLAMTSDINLKTNIKPDGKWLDTVHDAFTWDWSPLAKAIGVAGPTRGVIAQKVQKINPDAVKRVNGYLQVNYGAL